MWSTRSFGQKIGLGFAAVLFFTLLVSGLAIYALQAVIEKKDDVITINAQNLIDAAKLQAALDFVFSQKKDAYNKIQEWERQIQEIPPTQGNI